MKLKYLFFLASLGGAAIAPMYITGPNGKPLMTLDDWMPKDSMKMLSKVTSVADPVQQELSGAGKQVFYKWKDADGGWQMTQYKPTHLQASEVEERIIYANANIIQSLDTGSINQALTQAEGRKKFVYNPRQSAEEDTGMDIDGLDKTDHEGFSLSTVSMDKIPKLIQQAKNIDPALQNRQKNIDKMINQ